METKNHTMLNRGLPCATAEVYESSLSGGDRGTVLLG